MMIKNDNDLNVVSIVKKKIRPHGTANHVEQRIIGSSRFFVLPARFVGCLIWLIPLLSTGVEAFFVTWPRQNQLVEIVFPRRDTCHFPSFASGRTNSCTLSASLTNDMNLQETENDSIVKTISGPWNATNFGKSHCWGRHPLLIRNAFSDNDMSSLPSWDDIVELSCQNYEDDDDDVVTSRLIQHIPDTLDTYTAEFGPFPISELQQSLSNKDNVKEDDGDRPTTIVSTLVVNDVDRWIPDVSHWMDRHFGRYLPRWRRDDAQVSVAPTGGGIGPHVDNYDVFLLQVSGSRAWEVGPLNLSLGDEVLQLVEPSEVSVLNLTNNPSQSVTVHLEEGDCLYLPPRAVHCGTSTSDSCVTLSVGCRSPSASELLARVAEQVAMSTTMDSTVARYKDVDHPWMPLHSSTTATDKTIEACSSSSDGAEGVGTGIVENTIKMEMKRLLQQAVNDILDDDALWDDMVGQLITEPKRPMAEGGYPVPLRQMSEEWKTDLGIWADADATLNAILKGQGQLFRAEGVSFAASSPIITHNPFSSGKETTAKVVHRLFAQGRTFELCHGVTIDDAASTTTSALLCHIANGPPLNMETLFEMKLIPLPVGVRKFLHNLISEGILYGWTEDDEESIQDSTE